MNIEEMAKKAKKVFDRLEEEGGLDYDYDPIEILQDIFPSAPPYVIKQILDTDVPDEEG